jgi:predicted TIM-barrel fold metal-dependent hydrolase
MMFIDPHTHMISRTTEEDWLNPPAIDQRTLYERATRSCAAAASRGSRSPSPSGRSRSW